MNDTITDSLEQLSPDERNVYFLVKDSVQVIKVKIKFTMTEDRGFSSDPVVLGKIDHFVSEITEFWMKGEWHKQTASVISPTDVHDLKTSIFYPVDVTFTLADQTNQQPSNENENDLLLFKTNPHTERISNSLKAGLREYYYNRNKNKLSVVSEKDTINVKPATSTLLPKENSKNTTSVEASTEARLLQEKNNDQQSPSPKLTIFHVDQAKLKLHKVPLHQLQNARVGSDYNEKLLDVNQLVSIKVSVNFEPTESGLSFDPSTGLVKGTPVLACDLKVILLYQLEGQSNLNAWFETSQTVSVNPDPRSLWKNLPVDPTASYPKNDSDTGSWTYCGKSIIVASKRGRSHAHEGKFRDDDFKVRIINKEDWCIIVVADGAGSAKYSREGSRIACTEAIDFVTANISSTFATIIPLLETKTLLELDNQKAIRDAFYSVLGGAGLKAYNAIKNEATNSNVQAKDYATTFILSAIKKFRSGWLVGSYWVGDGGVGIYSKNKSVTLLGEPDGGEFAGQTRFLTSSEIWDPTEIYKRVRYSVVEDFTAIVSMTDGISDPMFESEANLNNLQTWDAFWTELNDKVNLREQADGIEKELLKWLDFWSPGNHDDRTLAIVY